MHISFRVDLGIDFAHRVRLAAPLPAQNADQMPYAAMSSTKFMNFADASGLHDASQHSAATR